MEKLQKLYKDNSITLVQLSKMTGISTSTIHRYVSGNVKVINYSYYDPILKVLEGEVIKEELIEEKHESSIDVHGLKDQINRNAFSGNNNIIKNPKRGELYYIKNTSSYGSEQFGNRPGLILSSDKLNSSMNTVTIVYLTGQPRIPLPCHVAIKTSRESIVLCEQIFTVSKERLINLMGHVTEAEMSMVNKGVMMGLGLTYQQINMNDSHDYQRLQIENRMLKEFNEKLMEIAMK